MQYRLNTVLDWNSGTDISNGLISSTVADLTDQSGVGTKARYILL